MLKVGYTGEVRSLRAPLREGKRTQVASKLRIDITERVIYIYLSRRRNSEKLDLDANLSMEQFVTTCFSFRSLNGGT